MWNENINMDLFQFGSDAESKDQIERGHGNCPEVVQTIM